MSECITDRRPEIEGKHFVRHFRDDCMFERRIVWDEDFCCYMAQAVGEGPHVIRGLDMRPVTELEALLAT